MKVIDLLNKITNGVKVPKKIKVNGIVFILDKDNNEYKIEDGNAEEIYTDCMIDGFVNLTNEVEIIEDKEYKKIEKLNTSKYFYVGPFNENLPKSYDIDVFKKINEIIDYINKEEK